MCVSSNVLIVFSIIILRNSAFCVVWRLCLKPLRLSLSGDFAVDPKCIGNSFTYAQAVSCIHSRWPP